MGRGGRRANQTGRPKGSTSAAPTKVVRVPANVDEKALVSLAEDLQTLVAAWQDSVHPTSPRYDRLRQAIDDVNRLLDGLGFPTTTK